MKALGVITLLLALLVIVAANAPPPPRSHAYEGPSPVYETAFHGVMVQFSTHDSSYGMVTLLNVRITNPNANKALRDFVLECRFAGNSGTIIGSDRRTVYEIVEPKTTKAVGHVTFGPVPDGGTYSSCHIISAAVAYPVVPPKAEPKRPAPNK